MTRGRGLIAASEEDDIAALAKGGRANILGFLLRLAARLPFLLIAPRLYGAAVLGRFAYAVLIVELAAQLATLGLKRGLAEQIAHGERPQSHVVADALLLCLAGCTVACAILIWLPEAMFPNSGLNGLDRLLPLIIFAVAITDVALAACAYQYNIAATVRARSIVEPWTISIASLGFFFYSARDGLILAYVAAMSAALVFALVPMVRHYGLPHGWVPHPGRLWAMTRRSLPLAGADAVEWGTRRLDLAILGLFASPATVGIYYVAQQVASLPQKLKTSFEPILGPVIIRNVASGNLGAIARQVRQVGFWILAAQLGVALALAIPGQAVMGLAGPGFAVGTSALAGLLAAEVLAAPAVVSEAALVYLARMRNLALSLVTIGLQAAATLALIELGRKLELAEIHIAALPAIGLAFALAFGALAKSLLLSRLCRASTAVWRSSLGIAALSAVIVGAAFTLLPHRYEWIELVVGVPAILAVYCAVLWTLGFGPEDRALFRASGLGRVADFTEDDRPRTD
jgi:O-antigen/teichoic acid export membrane protein